MTDYVYDKIYSDQIYKITYLFLINIIYSYNCNLYLLMFMYIGGLCTSLNYWKSPKYDYNRLLDICWISITIIIHYSYCNLIQNESNYLFYHIFLILAIIFYFSGRIYRFIYNDQKIATKCHINSHIFFHIANIILYYGLNNII